jgi:membrane-bound toxin of toxin-antitoxin system
MKIPPRLSVEMRPSRVALAAIAAACLVTSALVLSVALPFSVTVGLICTVVAAGVVALRTIAGGASPARIGAGIDRRIVVTTRAGRVRAGDILGDTFVAARLATIVWRPEGTRLARTLLVAADALPREEFRRLRVVLRYSRAPPALGATSGDDAG